MRSTTGLHSGPRRICRLALEDAGADYDDIARRGNGMSEMMKMMEAGKGRRRSHRRSSRPENS